jgi:two-component system, OmpR family, response regulator
MSQKPKIFLVEDDTNFGNVLRSYLEVQGFDVTLIEDGAKAVNNFRNNHYDMCILDVMLPHVDGFSIAREIRLINENIPLFFLTAKSMKEDVLKGFAMGADDYITKPFEAEVLLCKIKAILKRHCAQKEQSCQEEYPLGKYIFNSTFRTLCLDAQTIRLSPKESCLLELMCKNLNKVTTRETALKSIWGDDNYFTTRSMDVFVTKLRKYLNSDPCVEILNQHGNGYILSVKQEQA